MSAGRRRLGVALACSGAMLLTAALGAVPASGDVFSPIELVSAGTLGGGAQQQAEYAHDSVISADGAYVVFDGAVGGETGVWRVDLATRQIQQVAGGDALLPSVSEDGRYVSFTTNQTEAELVAGTRGLNGEPPLSEVPGAPGPENVYVRDMDLPPGAEGAFTVVSAVNGSDEPLSYEAAGTEKGSVAAGGAAISADGREVAFVTTAVSNLAGPATPAMQVAVRRIDSRETILVSGEYDPATGETSATPVAAGGRGAAFGAERMPQQVPEYSSWLEQRPPGAALSADGSTVAWMGVNVGLQARFLPAEAPLSEYTEPLWRRIAVPATPTERITGGSDPSNPECVASGERVLPEDAPSSDPCQGPFTTHPREAEPGAGDSGIWSAREAAKDTPGEFVPRLSRDGYTVAFLSRAEPAGLGEFFSAGRNRGEQADIYVADMHEGLSRDASLAPLTRIGSTLESESDAIAEFALSENGQQVAFTTRRTQFRLAYPAFISAPAPEPGLDELFYVDLADGTLTRVSHGYGGEDEASEQPHQARQPEEQDAYYQHPTAGATSPSFADDGTLLAFSSTASNLAPYDGNGPTTFNSTELGPRDGSDAFVVARETPSPLPTPQYVSPAPTLDTEPAWTLGATALARRDGSIVLYVRVPGAGTLSASALSGIVIARAARRGGASKASTHAKVAMRTVAGARIAVPGAEPEPLTLVLRPQQRYAGLAARAGGLSATVTVSFAAPGHPRLTQSLQVTFLHELPKHHAKNARSTRRRGRG
ncbi:MAG: TolB family protein [Solirubrobacteraceae bacterium]